MATTTLAPISDVAYSATYWAPDSGTDWFSRIAAHGSGWDHTDNDTTYVETTTVAQPMRVVLADTEGNTSEVTIVEMKIRANITDANSLAVLEGQLFDSAGTQIGAVQDVAGGDLGVYGTIGNHDPNGAIPWYWLTTKTKFLADGMEFEIRFAAAT